MLSIITYIRVLGFYRRSKNLPNFLIYEVRYKKTKDGIIEIFRNKRAPVRRVMAIKKNEDGCMSCCLFDECLMWEDNTVCDAMEKAKVIKSNYQDLFFVDV